MMRSALCSINFVVVAVMSASGCTLFDAGATPCDTNDECRGGLVCEKGFCARNDIVPAEGETGEGEGAGVAGEGEGATAGEGEGATTGEGEGTAGEGEGTAGEGEGTAGEGEGAVAGEGEGATAGEGEGEGVTPPTTVTLCGQQHAIPPWFDTNFQRRIPLAFCDTAAPDEAVAGLPATVILDSTNFAGFAQMLADGHDVIFVAESGTPHTLSYERQLFTAGSIAVFNVLTESFNPHSGLDDIWMYFDDPADDTDRSAPATVYADYASVWHFEANALLVDAKSGVNMANFLAGQNGNNVGNPPSATTGVVGGGIAIHGTGSSNQFDANADSFDFLQQFDGNFNAVAPPQVLNSSQGTISAMVNPNSFGHIALLGHARSSIGFDVSCGGPGNCGNNPGTSVNLSLHDQNDFGLYVTTNGGAIGQFTVLSASGVAQNGQFHHLAGAWGGTSEIIEADGVGAGSANLAVTSNINVSNIVLGMSEVNAVNNLNGVIDELRICTVPRDVAFLRAERQGYTKSLFALGTILSQ